MVWFLAMSLRMFSVWKFDWLISNADEMRPEYHLIDWYRLRDWMCDPFDCVLSYRCLITRLQSLEQKYCANGTVLHVSWNISIYIKQSINRWVIVWTVQWPHLAFASFDAFSTITWTFSNNYATLRYSFPSISHCFNQSVSITSHMYWHDNFLLVVGAAQIVDVRQHPQPLTKSGRRSHTKRHFDYLIRFDGRQFHYTISIAAWIDNMCN